MRNLVKKKIIINIKLKIIQIFLLAKSVMVIIQPKLKVLNDNSLAVSGIY